jgi:hypothetical protein
VAFVPVAPAEFLATVLVLALRSFLQSDEQCRGILRIGPQFRNRYHVPEASLMDLASQFSSRFGIAAPKTERVLLKTV